MTIAPAFFLTVTNLLINLGAFIYSLIWEPAVTEQIFYGNLEMILIAYFLLFAVGLITMITEGKNIHCSTRRKILSIITFPFFMLTYIPISIHSLFSHVEWKPITHSVAINLEDLDQASA